MEHPFTAVLTYKAQRGLFPALAGKLFENDQQIATFWRDETHDHFVPPIESRFVDSAAQSRFDDFADSLSIEETIEALIPR